MSLLDFMKAAFGDPIQQRQGKSLSQRLIPSNESTLVEKRSGRHGNPDDYERWDFIDTDYSNYGLRPDHSNTRNELSDFLELYEVHPWVYSCVRAIATACASVEYQVLGPTGEKTENHPITRTLARPNPQQVWFQFDEEVKSYLELCGNAFIEEVRDDEGVLVGMYALRPDKFRILPHPKTYVAGYIYEPRPGAEILFGTDEITHIRYFSPTDPYWGISPSYAAQNSLILDMYATAYNKKFFTNSAVPEGVLETEGSISNDTYKRLKLDWDKRHRGISNAFTISILEEGLKYRPIGFNMRDMQMAELKKLSREEILAVFRVPPSIVGLLEAANSTPVREQKKMFWMDNVLPKLKMFSEVFNQHIMPKDFKLKFITDSISSLIEDVQVATQVSMSLVSHAILTINEVRQRFYGLGPVEWGNKPWIPVGLAQYGSEVHADPTGSGGEGLKQPDRIPYSNTQTAMNRSTPMGGSLPSKPDDQKEKRAVDFEKIMIAEPDWTDVRKVRNWQKWNVWKAQATPDYRRIKTVILKHFKDELKRVTPIIKMYYPAPPPEIVEKNKNKGAVTRIIEDAYTDPMTVWKAHEFRPEVDRMLLEVSEENAKLKLKLTPVAKSVVKKHGQFSIADIGAKVDFSMSNQRVLDFLDDFGGRNVTGINETTREILGRELSKGIEAGEDFDDVMRTISDVFEGDIAESRARLIARTETVSLTQFSKLEGAMQSGVVKTKRWVSELLSTTRDTQSGENHLELHDVEIPLDSKFEARSRSGTDLMFGPGDPTAKPENVCNCLCILDFPGTTEEFEDIEGDVPGTRTDE